MRGTILIMKQYKNKLKYIYMKPTYIGNFYINDSNISLFRLAKSDITLSYIVYKQKK